MSFIPRNIRISLKKEPDDLDKLVVLGKKMREFDINMDTRAWGCSDYARQEYLIELITEKDLTMLGGEDGDENEDSDKKHSSPSSTKKLWVSKSEGALNKGHKLPDNTEVKKSHQRSPRKVEITSSRESIGRPKDGASLSERYRSTKTQESNNSDVINPRNSQRTVINVKKESSGNVSVNVRKLNANDECLSPPKKSDESITASDITASDKSYKSEFNSLKRENEILKKQVKAANEREEILLPKLRSDINNYLQLINEQGRLLEELKSRIGGQHTSVVRREKKKFSDSCRCSGKKRN